MIYELINWKGPGAKSQSSQSFKTFSKNMSYNYIYYLVQFHELMIYDTKFMLQNVTLPMS